MSQFLFVTLSLDNTKSLLPFCELRDFRFFTRLRSMFPLWEIIYGIAWVAWLCCVIGGLGSAKVLTLCSNKDIGFQPSPRYINGIQLSQYYQQEQMTAV